MSEKRVAVVIASESDLPTMEGAERTLVDLGVGFERHMMSAHRTPDRVRAFATGAEEKGYKVIIAAAGGAAHLAGVIASHTLLPVIGVPLDSSPIAGGLDALLSTVQMPGGVPVATVSVGSWGAKNAAVLAAEILALEDPAIREALLAYRKAQEARYGE